MNEGIFRGLKAGLPKAIYPVTDGNLETTFNSSPAVEVRAGLRLSGVIGDVRAATRAREDSLQLRPHNSIPLFYSH